MQFAAGPLLGFPVPLCAPGWLPAGPGMPGMDMGGTFECSPILKLKGLPFAATAVDIAAFFEGTLARSLARSARRRPRVPRGAR
jgi:hypothetical protein